MHTDRLLYPITTGYLDHVDDPYWWVVRELGTNAMDQQKDFVMKRENGKLVFISKGPMSLSVRHLLLGVSEGDDDRRGQFGEGLKLALLILTKSKVKATILSDRFKFWNEPGEMFGEDVMTICWEEHPDTLFDGTRIEIPWAAGSPTYEDRFLRPGDPRIVYTDQWGRSILSQDDPDIFVKGIWVQKASGWSGSYAFGYDLVYSKMNRDRGVIATWDLNSEIGKTWASVSDIDLLTKLFTSVDTEASESGIYLYGSDIKDRDAFRKAWKRVHGNFAVVRTSDDMEREAEHRGASTVKVGSSMKEALSDICGTDEEYIHEMEGSTAVPIADKELEGDAIKNLRFIRRLAKKVGFGGKLRAFLLKNRDAEYHKGDIKVDAHMLVNPNKAVAALIHELAHARSSHADGTAEYQQDVLAVAAELILSSRRN